MQRIIIKLISILVCTGLTACDIQPISVGSWQTETKIADDIIQAMWTITANETLQSAGGWTFSVQQVELDGSRIAFSSQVPLATGTFVDGNFSGTVSGDALQGTFFTTAGNFTVAGQRQ